MSVFAPLFQGLKTDLSIKTLFPFVEIGNSFYKKEGKQQQFPTTFQTTLTTKALEEDFISSGGVEVLLEFVRGDDIKYDAAMCIMNFLTPEFPLVCEKIGTNKEVIQIMVKHIHPDSRKHMKFNIDHSVISITFANLRFISAVEATHDVLISSGVLDAARTVMEKIKECEFYAILLIANLIGPSEAKESSHMVASEDFLGKLLQVFEKGEFKGRTVIFHTLFPAFRRLTVNDQNKMQLVKRGFVPIWISKLDEIKEDENTHTLSEMLEVMLNLSLLDENHPVLMEGEIPDVLKKFAAEVVTTEGHKKLMEQILWKLGVLQPHIKTPLANIPTTPETTQRPTIMLSYNWEHQPIVKDIAKKLKEEGYRVWLDLDEMVGSSVEAMANAVEMSQVVIVCMSRKYKESPNCRLEGEYAFKRRKVIIPLLMQSQYDADGWLGAIIGTKIYYKFTHTDLFEAGFQGLLKELNKLGLSATTEKPPLVVKQPFPSSEQGANTKPKVDPTSWSTTQVGEWLRGVGFGGHCATFSDQEIDGKALVSLAEAIKTGSPCGMWAVAIVQPGGGLGFNTIGQSLRFFFELKKLFS